MMGKLKYNEQSVFFLAVLVICAGQGLAVFVGDDWSFKMVCMICSLLIAIPLMLFVIIKVNRHNHLVENGKVIKAIIHHEETKCIHIRSIVIINIVCFYTCEDITHMFKGEYSVGMYEYKKVKQYISHLSELEVLVDDTYKNYEILLENHIGRQNDIDLQVPYMLSLCVELCAAVFLFLNIIELFL